MANQLSIYIDGEYYGLAVASASQVALHTDEREYDAWKAFQRFSSMLGEPLLRKIRRGEVTGKIKLVDENKY